MALYRNLGRWDYRLIVWVSPRVMRAVRTQPSLWDRADDLSDLADGAGLQDLGNFFRPWANEGVQSRRLLEGHSADQIFALEDTAQAAGWGPASSLASYWLLGFHGSEVLAKRFTADLYRRIRARTLSSLAEPGAVPGKFHRFSKLLGPVRPEHAEDDAVIRDSMIRSLCCDLGASNTVRSIPFCTGFRQPGTMGLNFDAAWKANHKGQGVRLVDIEAAWNLEHPELKGSSPVHHIYNHDFEDAYCILHGTKTLATLIGGSNSRFPLGVAPELECVGVASQYRRNAHGVDELWDVAGAILKAISVLRPGDILLLETQTLEELPVEVVRPFFDAIRVATGNGIVVIEPAGNGDHDLDGGFSGTQYEDNPRLEKRRRGMSFDTCRRDRDSGAIMVGACQPVSNDGDPDCNYGQRVDCYAWGSYVRTVGHPGDRICLDGDEPEQGCHFEETSAASALIAGAAALTQEMAKKYRGDSLSPTDLRALLSNPKLGTLCNGTRPIGVMPDLGKIQAFLQQHPAAS